MNCRSARSVGIAVLGLAGLGLGALPAVAQDPRINAPEKLQRLRAELLKRKMTDLYREFEKQHPNLPPPKPEERIPIVERLARASADPDEQRQAWDELLNLYADWIKANPENYKDRIAFRFKYSSAIQGAAEEYINAIQLRGGTPHDFAELNKLATRHVELLAETARLFEQIDANANTGNLGADALEELNTKGEYALNLDWDLAWAQFHLALSLSNDSTKADALKKAAQAAADAMDKVYDTEAEPPKGTLRGKPAAEGNVLQGPANLLFGMSKRLLGQYDDADKAFEFVVHTLEPTIPPEQANNPQAVEALTREVLVLKFKARFEQVKVLRDKAKTVADLDAASKDADELVTWLKTTPLGKQPIFEVVSLLLQSNILSRKADLAAKAGNAPEAQKLREQASAPLVAFGKAHPTLLGMLNEEVFRMVEGVDDPTKLDSFMLQAKVAILLPRAYAIEDDPKIKDEKEKRAKANAEYKKLIGFAEELLKKDDEMAKALKPATLYNLAAAYNSLGQDDPSYRFKSAQTFFALAEQFPQNEHTRESLERAIDILYPMTREAGASKDVSELFNKCLDVLIRNYPDTEYAKLGTYQVAMGEYNRANELVVQKDKPDTRVAKASALREAAIKLGRVPAEHPLYTQAQKQRAIALWQSYTTYATGSTDTAEIKARAKDVVDAAAESAKLLTAAAAAKLKEADDPKLALTEDEKAKGVTLEQKKKALTEEGKALQADAATVLVFAADTQMSDKVGNPAEALKLIEDLEKKYPDADEAIGKALRIRITGYRKQGKDKEAAGLLDDFIRLDPESAGPVIGALLGKAQEELNNAKAEGKPPAEIQPLAGDVTSLAEKMVGWAEQQKDMDADKLFAYRRIRALAYVDAAQSAADYDKAAEMLQALSDQRAKDGAAFKADLEKAREAKRLALLQEPDNIKLHKELEAKAVALQVKVEPDPRVQIGLADCRFETKKWKEARDLYRTLTQQVSREDAANFYKVQYRAYLCALELGETDPAEKEKARELVSEQVSRLLKINTGSMAGYRPQFEELLTRAGGAPATATAPGRSPEEEAAKKAEADRIAREEQAARNKKLMVFGIYGGVAVVVGIVGWVMLKRRSRYMTTAHLKKPVQHHGELEGTGVQVVEEAPPATEGDPTAPAGDAAKPDGENKPQA